MRFPSIVPPIALLVALPAPAQEAGFVSLFNGRDLTGWVGDTASTVPVGMIDERTERLLQLVSQAHVQREVWTPPPGVRDKKPVITQLRALNAEAGVLIPVAPAEVDPELGLLLAAEAARLSPTSRVADTLRRALLVSHLRAVLPERRVTTASFSPDGARVVVGTAGGSVRVYATGARTRVTAFQADGAVAHDGHAGRLVVGEGGVVVHAEAARLLQRRGEIAVERVEGLGAVELDGRRAAVAGSDRDRCSRRHLPVAGPEGVEVHLRRTLPWIVETLGEQSTVVRGSAPTVAVLGCGIDRTYPAEHRELVEDVVLRADKQLNTLLDYRYQQHFKAKKGGHGKGQAHVHAAGVMFNRRVNKLADFDELNDLIKRLRQSFVHDSDRCDP